MTAALFEISLSPIILRAIAHQADFASKLKTSGGGVAVEHADSVEGVNLLSHFCNPSGIQQAALWTKAAFEPMRRSSLGIPEHHRVFLFMFDLHSQLHRKNPMGVVRAFQKAFRRDDAATLVVKTSGGDIHFEDLAFLRATVHQ